jgi:hypothetical protein
VTDEEHDLLRLVYAEAKGSVKKWVALTELPAAALALARNGYINVHQAGAHTWQVAMTESGRALVGQLTGEKPPRRR